MHISNGNGSFHIFVDLKSFNVHLIFFFLINYWPSTMTWVVIHYWDTWELFQYAIAEYTCRWLEGLSSTPVTRSVCPRSSWTHSSVAVLYTLTHSPEAHRRNLHSHQTQLFRGWPVMMQLNDWGVWGECNVTCTRLSSGVTSGVKVVILRVFWQNRGWRLVHCMRQTRRWNEPITP